jgi:hypothetical protein
MNTGRKNVWIRFVNQTDRCSAKALHFYSGGSQFESRIGLLAVLTKVYGGFLLTCDECWCNTFKQARTASFKQT